MKNSWFIFSRSLIGGEQICWFLIGDIKIRRIKTVYGLVLSDEINIFKSSDLNIPEHSMYK